MMEEEKLDRERKRNEKKKRYNESIVEKKRDQEGETGEKEKNGGKMEDSQMADILYRGKPGEMGSSEKRKRR